jgi:hypothetical protein
MVDLVVVLRLGIVGGVFSTETRVREMMMVRRLGRRLSWGGSCQAWAMMRVCAAARMGRGIVMVFRTLRSPGFRGR